MAQQMAYKFNSALIDKVMSVLVPVAEGHNSLLVMFTSQDSSSL